MSPKLLLKVFPVVLLMLVQSVGMGGVARSQNLPLPYLKLPDSYPQPSIPRYSGNPVTPAEHLDIQIQNLRQSAEAGFYRSEEIEQFRIIGQPALPKLLPLLQAQNAKLRSHAVLALGQIEGAEKLTLATLIPLLKDPDVIVRENVAQVLTNMGEAAASAVPELTAALSDSDRKVRLQAASALGEMKNAALPAVPKLIAMLNDPDNRVRRRASYTLGDIGTGGSPAVPALTLLLQDPDVDVRRSAAVALGNMGEAAKSAVPALKLLLQDPDKYVRRDAAWALNPQKQAGEVAPDLIDIRRVDVEQQQRDWEGRILGLIQTLKTGNANQKTSAIRALVEIGQPVVPYIIPLFKDTNPGIQSIAAATLDQIELQAIVPRPDALFSSALPLSIVRMKSPFDPPLPDISVDAAIKALRETTKAQRLEGFSAPKVPSISRELYSRSPYHIAVEQLQEIGQPAVPKLIALLEDDDDVTLRSNATEILGTIGALSPERSVPSLTALLRHPDANTRSNAARVLARWGKVTKPTLITLLKDPNSRVRSGAAEAIGRMGDAPKSAIPFLMPLLKDENPLVRAYAVFALKNMGGFAKPSIPALTALLKDENEKVRLLTSQVLTSLKSDNALAVAPSPSPQTSVPPPGFPSAPPTSVASTRTVKQEIQLLRDADNYDDRRNATVRLIRIGKPAVVELIPLLNDEYPEIRAFARDALLSIGEPAIPALLPFLKDENPNFRYVVAAVLGDMGTPSKLRTQTLMRLLKDPDAKIRSLSARAIRWIGVPAQSAVPDLISLLRDPDIQVRSNTLQAIGSIGKPAAAAIPFIIPLLREQPLQSENNDPLVTGFNQPDIRNAAASALASMGELARPALLDILPMLQDRRSGAQNYAFDVINALGASTHTEVIPNLLPLLQEDGKPELQSGMARILGNLGEPAKVAIPDLTRLLNSRWGNVRSSAAEALKKLGYKP